ncbi:MAG: DUF1614 domain-containing protein [Thermodesulfobacteriota bacterium]
MFFTPLTFLFMLIFFIFLLFFFTLVQINLVALAFMKIGIPPQHVFTALFATLLGSYINIPVKKIPQESMTAERRMSFFGFVYAIPFRRKQVTVLAVNVGGAVIPAFISFYLLLKTGLYFQTFIATIIMSGVCFRLAKPIRGVGIAMPFFVPPLLAALLSVIIGYDRAPVIAYISGTLGTLIGADILNLKKIRNLGAPVASIGGAGTFDGIFLTGILAVILSAFLT